MACHFGRPCSSEYSKVGAPKASVLSAGGAALMAPGSALGAAAPTFVDLKLRAGPLCPLGALGP
eukprot:1709498-Alexandrium_andersonii.AAC.1